MLNIVPATSRAFQLFHGIKYTNLTVQQKNKKHKKMLDINQRCIYPVFNMGLNLAYRNFLFKSL